MPDSDLSYDSIETGKLYGPYYYPLADRFGRHMEAIENDHEWHTRRSPAGPPVAPPTLLGTMGIRFVDDVAPVPPASLHLRQEIEIKNWIRSDRKPILYGQFTEKSEKRGRKRFTFEAKCRDDTGLILGVTRVTTAFPTDGDVETSDRDRKSKGVKSELPAVTRTVTQDKITAYSEDEANAQRGTSIHVQPDAAKAAGYEATVAQGLMAFDYIGEMMERHLERAWYEYAGLSVTFLAPTLEGQTLTTGGRLAEEHEEGAVIRQVYEVWCDNDAGETVAAGTATALAIPKA